MHAIHYHQVSVPERQEELISRTRADLKDILSIPLLKDPESLTPEEIQAELDNNCQGLGNYCLAQPGFLQELNFQDLLIRV